MKNQTQKRKALMLSPEAHDALMRLASHYEATQSELVDAIVVCLDTDRIDAFFIDRARERESAAAEANERRILVEQLMESISLAELKTIVAARKEL